MAKALAIAMYGRCLGRNCRAQPALAKRHERCIKQVFSETERGLTGRPPSLTNPTIGEAKVERVFWNRAADRCCHPLQLGMGCLAYVQMPVS